MKTMTASGTLTAGSASRRLEVHDAAISAVTAGIGRAAGPPWAADQRHAAAAAWAALG